MKINKLYIKNYGILEEVTLYPSKVNVLTGDNGNGKSTVSQVIRYLFTNESVGSLKDVVDIRVVIGGVLKDVTQAKIVKSGALKDIT